MAITSTIESNAVTIKLNAGVGSDGQRILKNLNLTGIKSTAFSQEDKQKLYNIVTALMPLLTYSLYNVTLTQKETIEEE